MLTMCQLVTYGRVLGGGFGTIVKIYFVCRGDQPIIINVVVKVGGGWDRYIGAPPRF